MQRVLGSLPALSYPKDLLASREAVVYEFGSHWFGLVKEALVTIAYVVLFILLVPDGVNGRPFTIITLLWLWIAIGGFMEWRTRERT